MLNINKINQYKKSELLYSDDFTFKNISKEKKTDLLTHFIHYCFPNLLASIINQWHWKASPIHSFTTYRKNPIENVRQSRTINKQNEQNQTNRPIQNSTKRTTTIQNSIHTQTKRDPIREPRFRRKARTSREKLLWSGPTTAAAEASGLSNPRNDGGPLCRAFANREPVHCGRMPGNNSESSPIRRVLMIAGVCCFELKICVYTGRVWVCGMFVLYVSVHLIGLF